MIQISGKPLKPSSKWPTDSIERKIIQNMLDSPEVYWYNAINELSFELRLRKNIIASAKEMSKGQAQFTIFAWSRSNAKYWQITYTGGFQLKNGVTPSDAIRDIFKNSSLYAFECATAQMMVYYHAILNSLGDYVFNRLFQNLYLYSWHADPDLGLHSIRSNHHIPGDIVYFNNPDVNPKTPWWRGENCVVLEDGKYFGHGMGLRTAKETIEILNKARRPGSYQSSYLTNLITRPSFKHLARFATQSQRFSTNKIQPSIIHHNKDSISHFRYQYYLENEADS